MRGSLLLWISCSLFISCSTGIKLQVPKRTSTIGGNDFYKTAFPFKWAQRDSFVISEVFRGNVPSFLQKLVPIHVSVRDEVSGNTVRATYFVTPDYLSIGTDDNWARVNITPRAAQKIADSFYCFLPTRKMVDDIYRAAEVKLEPVSMYAFRDSTPTMFHHHLIVEGQRKGRKGLIAGIQKDVVISGKLNDYPKADRVAIYGWHRTDGKPIQPLNTGHVFWYVDYSQGIRLAYQRVKVDGKWMHYTDVLKHPVLKKLLCDEVECGTFRYVY